MFGRRHRAAGGSSKGREGLPAAGVAQLWRGAGVEGMSTFDPSISDECWRALQRELHDLLVAQIGQFMSLLPAKETPSPHPWMAVMSLV